MFASTYYAVANTDWSTRTLDKVPYRLSIVLCTCLLI